LTLNKGVRMKISEIKHYTPALELRKAKPAGGSQDEVVRPPAEKVAETGESNRETKSAPELPSDPSLTDLQPFGVRNDFSAQYRRAELALEGTIYRLAKMQSALQDSAGDSEGVTALPGNIHLQQTADKLSMLAHIESVKFRKGD
jgi:hypothetical protein